MKQIYNLLLLATLMIWSCGRPIAQGLEYDAQYVDSTIKFVYVDSQIQVHAGVDSMVKDYKTNLEKTMDQVIGFSSRPLTKAQPECTLGYLAVDALMQFILQKDTSVVGAIINYGGIRINYLASGPITLGNVYEIMPFDNTVVVVHVPGTVLKQWIQHITTKGGWPIVGIQYEVKDKIASNITINNKAINDHLIYKIATTDYVANGGDDCAFLKGLKRTSYNKFHRDTMIEFIKNLSSQGDTLNYSLENRVNYHE